MALVSISEASRLTNKSRTTVHRYISKGKLSIPMEGERHAFTLTPSNGAKPFAVWHDSARKRVNSGW